MNWLESNEYHSEMNICGYRTLGFSIFVEKFRKFLFGRKIDA